MSDDMDAFDWIIVGFIIASMLLLGYLFIDATITWAQQPPPSELPINRIFDAVRKELGGSE